VLFRTPLRSITPILVSLAAACDQRLADKAGRAPAAASPALSATSAAPEHRPDPSIANATGFLVWTVDDVEGEWLDAVNARTETVWIDTAGRVLQRRAGILAIANGRIWHWRERIVTVRGLNCECYWRESSRDPSGATCIRSRPLRTVALKEVGGTGSVTIHGIPDPEHLIGEQPPLQIALPAVAAGPWLFVDAHGEGTACGAHGFAYTARLLVDLRIGRVVPTDTVAISDEDSSRAMEILEATQEGEEAVAGFTFGDQEAQWTEADTLAMLDRYFTSAAYAFSDEGSYSRSERLPRLQPRRWIAGWTHAPAGVRRFWAQSPRHWRAGWSLVTQADSARLHRAFASSEEGG
jgi:hypothetical protein